MSQISQHPELIELTALVDGELSAGEAHAVQQHLSDCHACTLRVLSATQLKAATARGAQRFVPSPAALQRLASQLVPHETARSSRHSSSSTWRWAAVAAVLIFAVAISLTGWWQMKQTNDLTAELLDQHLAVLSSGAQPEVVSSDRHTVKPWFQGKLPFSFNLPETLPPDTALQGGDLTFLDGQPAALLLFTIQKHRVSVFVTQRSVDGSILRLPANQSGFAIQRASTRNLHITAVSDVNPAELERLVAALAAVQSPA